MKIKFNFGNQFAGEFAEIDFEESFFKTEDILILWRNGVFVELINLFEEDEHLDKKKNVMVFTKENDKWILMLNSAEPAFKGFFKPIDSIQIL